MKPNIQYFCFAGFTRSVMAENLSRKLEPTFDFTSAGVRAESCWYLETPDRIKFLANTALKFLNDPLNDFSYEGGCELRDLVEGKVSELDVENLDMERFRVDLPYATNMRAGLENIIKYGLAPNEVLLRNLTLREYGVNVEKDNAQLVQKKKIDLYLGMTPKLVDEAKRVIGSVKVQYIGDFAETQLLEPEEIFAIGRVEPYYEYAKQLYEFVLPSVIQNATRGGN